MTQQIVVGLIVALVCLLAARRVIKAARGKSCCNCGCKDCEMRDKNKDKVKSKQ
jgi:hypothetical protein